MKLIGPCPETCLDCKSDIHAYSTHLVHTHNEIDRGADPELMCECFCVKEPA